MSPAGKLDRLERYQSRPVAAVPAGFAWRKYTRRASRSTGLPPEATQLPFSVRLNRQLIAIIGEQRDLTPVIERGDC